MGVDNAFDMLVEVAKHIFRTRTTGVIEVGEPTSPEIAAIAAVDKANTTQRRKAAAVALQRNVSLDHSELAVNLQGETYGKLSDEALTKAVAVALLDNPEVAAEWKRRKSRR